MSINIQIIRTSFELVKHKATLLADRFYQILLNDYPETNALFASVDMPKQKAALIGALETAVDKLDNPDALTRIFLAMGERHVKYGAIEIHYKWVGAALLKALGECLGDSWTKELNEQWASVYGILAEVMKTGAKRSANLRSNTPPVEKDNGQGGNTLSNVHIAKPKAKIPMNQEAKSLDAITSTLTSDLALPTQLKMQIHKAVSTAVVNLIKSEVQRCYQEEIRRIETISDEELMRLAS